MDHMGFYGNCRGVLRRKVVNRASRWGRDAAEIFPCGSVFPAAYGNPGMRAGICIDAAKPLSILTADRLRFARTRIRPHFEKRFALFRFAFLFLHCKKTSTSCTFFFAFAFKKHNIPHAQLRGGFTLNRRTP